MLLMVWLGCLGPGMQPDQNDCEWNSWNSGGRNDDALGIGGTGTVDRPSNGDGDGTWHAESW